MATAVTTETPAKDASLEAPPAAKPDVEKIMADIRRAARARTEGETKSEREFRSDVKKRMLKPLDTRGAFSDDFTERVRSRESSLWNVRLTAAQFHSSEYAAMRALRWLLTPLARLLLNVHPAVRQAERQAEINEYHRRLLWATNRDLELARLQINLIRSELRQLGVHADFSFSPAPAGQEAGPRSGGSGRSRQEGRSRDGRGRQDGQRRQDGRSRQDGRGRQDGGRGRQDGRGRGGRGRGEGGRSDRDRSDRDRSDRDGSGRRERQGQGSRPPRGSSGRQEGRPGRGGRRPANGEPTGEK